MTSPHVRLLSAASLALLACTACGGSSGIDAQERGGSVALVSSRSDSGSDAEVRGEVTIGEGGCLALRAEGYDKPVPLVWPEGSSLADDGRSIEVPDAGRVRIGQQITGGGGEVTDPQGADYADVPAACLRERILMVVSKVDSVT